MHIDTFLKRAPSYLDENIAVHLIGSSGIGKSDAVHHLKTLLEARDGHEWGISTNLLGMQTPPDLNGVLMGAMRDVKDDKGKVRQQLVSEWSLPPWMISDDGRPMNSFKRGFVFFDERDKADADTVKAAAEPLLHRRAGRHQLHAGIGVLSCSNAKEHRSGSSREFDFIINREARWTIRPHVGSWLNWAHRVGMHALFTTYAETHPEIVFGDTHPKEQGPWLTPRSFVRFCKIVKRDYMGTDGVMRVTMENRDLLLEEGAGMVGVPAIEDFLSWIKVQTDVPTLDEIVKSPTTALVPVSPDAIMLALYMAAAGMTKKNAEPVIDYVLRLPPEMHGTFAMAALRRDKTLATAPAMNRKLAVKNIDVMQALSEL